MAADAAAAARPAGSAVLNINCAVMGHVDAGKTSLVRALSTELSTAALDKHPQSQERGITLDLGFSAFQTELPPHLAGARNPDGAPYERLQFTLVDCPGHASLIRTVIGGAQIIDMMLLVIDAVKGIQTQTAECLVIGEVTTEHMVVVINKIDMLLAAAAPAGADAAEREKLVRCVLVGSKGAQYAAEGGPLTRHQRSSRARSRPSWLHLPVTVLLRSALTRVTSAAPTPTRITAPLAPQVDKVVAKVRKALSSTKFADAPFVALSAAPGGGGKMGAAAPLADAAGGVKAQSDTVAQLVTTMKETVRLPQRDAGGPFFFAIDHCFPIKGQGTVLTGTVLSGACRVNDAIELPALRQSRKVKSMQMFKKPVQLVRQGDRAGICVTNLDATLIERGVAASPGTGERERLRAAMLAGGPDSQLGCEPCRNSRHTC
jgi:selenocysteine-specific elongation factor